MLRVGDGRGEVSCGSETVLAENTGKYGKTPGQACTWLQYLRECRLSWKYWFGFRTGTCRDLERGELTRVESDCREAGAPPLWLPRPHEETQHLCESVVRAPGRFRGVPWEPLLRHRFPLCSLAAPCHPLAELVSAASASAEEAVLCRGCAQGPQAARGHPRPASRAQGICLSWRVRVGSNSNSLRPEPGNEQ